MTIPVLSVRNLEVEFLTRRSALRALDGISFDIAKGEVLIEVTDAGFDTTNEKRVSFSEREKQVVELLAQGLKNKEIAAAMNLAEGTVKVYLSRLFKKTKVRDRFELMLYRAQDRKLLNNGDITGRVATIPQTPPTLAEFVPAPQVREEVVIAS